MSQLVQIKEVMFYVGLTANAQKTYEMREYLKSKGIPHTPLNYLDEAAHQSVFEALGSWYWGEAREKRTFSDFPIVAWVLCYDDFTTVPESATTPAEIESKLLPHKALIK